MSLTHERGGRDLAAACAPVLDAWTGALPFVAALHSGDVGWHLRNDDESLRGAFRVWRADGEPVAFALVDDDVLRTALAPGRLACEAVAAEVARDLGGIEHVDAPAGSALRHHLLARGWAADPAPWVLLHKDLDGDDADRHDPDSRTLDGAADVEGRVAVQRSAFSPGSSFTVDLWRTMAAGPTYDPRFEMVTFTPDGRPAAAATGWFAGPGRCAIFEPVGTHRDHRRQGYGRRVNRAVMAALARAGASGIRVHTPAANVAAVATYRACGLRPVDLTSDLVRVAA